MVIDFFFFCLLISLHELGILIDLLIYWRQYKTLKLSVSLSLSVFLFFLPDSLRATGVELF